MHWECAKESRILTVFVKKIFLQFFYAWENIYIEFLYKKSSTATRNRIFFSKMLFLFSKMRIFLDKQWKIIHICEPDEIGIFVTKLCRNSHIYNKNESNLQIFTRMRSNWAISTKSSQICHFLWSEPDSSRPFFASLNVT